MLNLNGQMNFRNRDILCTVMKTRLSLCVLLFIIVNQTTNAQIMHQSDVDHDAFLGKVKTCLQTTLSPSANTSQALKQLRLKTLSYYDLKGNKTEIATYDANDNVINRTNYQYNSSGLQTGYNTSRGTTGDKITYKSDNDGRTIQTISYKSGGFLTRKLDAHNRILEASIFAPNNQLIQTTIYQYDKFGNKIDSKTSKDGVVIAMSKSNYDTHHQIIKTENYRLLNNKLIANNFIYFNNGSIAKKVYYDSEGKITRQEDYLYPLHDNKGNWTECDQKTNGKLDKIVKREFTYYE